MGVSSEEKYQEGGCIFENGDALVLYSDGLIDAQSEIAIGMALWLPNWKEREAPGKWWIG